MKERIEPAGTSETRAPDLWSLERQYEPTDGRWSQDAILRKRADVVVSLTAEHWMLPSRTSIRSG